MLILKVELIEAIGIITTMVVGTITSVIFIGVLIYQIKATRAATAQAARLRPNIVIRDPGTIDTTKAVSIKFPIENVGFTLAYQVTPSIRVITADGTEIEQVSGTDDGFGRLVAHDMPPRNEISMSLNEGDDEDDEDETVIERVIGLEAGLVFEVSVPYSLSPDSPASQISKARFGVKYDEKLARFNILSGQFDRHIG